MIRIYFLSFSDQIQHISRFIGLEVVPESLSHFLSGLNICFIIYMIFGHTQCLNGNYCCHLSGHPHAAPAANSDVLAAAETSILRQLQQPHDVVRALVQLLPQRVQNTPLSSQGIFAMIFPGFKILVGVE